ncbi:MAG: genomic island protein [Candidatus Competibacter denitrificans]
MSDQRAREVWERYEYGRNRGHREYCAQARLCERFYLGGGLQWSPEDLAILKEAGRPAHEINLIMPAVNAAVGYQIHNRMDISYRPRGNGADDQLASAHSKVAMQIADRNHLHWKETEVFADGLIQQRGYFDVRIDFDDNLMGSVIVDVLDPLDVIPDPDAKGYTPNEWSDVLITRWLTLDTVELLYGKAARREVEARKPTDADFGEESLEEGRNKFGGANSGGVYDAWRLDGYGHIPRVRVVEQRRWEMTRQAVAIYPTGDIRPFNEGDTPPDGAVITKKTIRRPKLTVATQDSVLHDEWSPYRRLMIIPYFPFFRRGMTRGMVDAAISPQEALNKAMSQYLHILNTTANSGWIVEEGSLTNMTIEQLEAQGAQTGLVVEYKGGTTPPVKIQANQIPTGIDRMIERAQAQMAEVTGINDAFKGMTDTGIESGVAIQSRQQAAQNSIALPLDNLARTRHLLAEHILELVQQFYTEPRVLRITEMDLFGKQKSKPLAINQPTETGVLFNDLTIGEYDVVITEQPMQVTFENGQFQQSLELRKAGVMVPDEIVIRHSNLADKEEVAKAMAERGQQVDPTLAAKADLLKVQAEKTQAEMVNKAVEAQYSAIQTAQTIAAIPQTAGLADSLLKSAGYVDRDAAPIVPQLTGPVRGVAPPPTNTNPLTPPNPDAGITAGMESQAP